MKQWYKALAIATLVALAPLAYAEIGTEQTTCPVMVGNPIDPSLYVDHEGQRIYFCCKTCVQLFTESPEEYIHNLPQFASKESTHDHSAGHDEETEPDRLVSYLGKYHPVAVHLPIALVLGAALAELLFMLTWNYLFRNVAVFNLLVAMLGAVAAVPLGLMAASCIRYPTEYGMAPALHKWLGIATLLLTAATSALALWATRKTAEKNSQIPSRLAPLTCVVLVGATGHFGGLLVYGLEHFSW